MVTLSSGGGQSGQSDIVIDATSVYWTNGQASTVLKIPILGGTLTTLASAQPGTDGIAVDGTNVYWANRVSGSGTINKIPRGGGGTITVLATNQSSPSSLVLDATHAYWTNYSANAVMKVPLAGGTPVTLASNQSLPNGIAVDASCVYWTNAGSLGSVMKAAR